MGTPEELTFAQMRPMLLWGAVGGMLPTLGRIAGTYAADFAAPPPAWVGVLIAITLYGVIGAVVARAMGNTEMKHALFAGIAAPAVVLSVLNGASEAKGTKSVTNLLKTTSSAIAGDIDIPSNTYMKYINFNTAKPTFRNDFVWALGGTRAMSNETDARDIIDEVLTRYVRKK